MADKKVEFILNAEDNASKVFEKIGKSAEKLQKQQKKVGEAFKTMGKGVVVAGAAATGALVASAKAAIEWESAFAGVAKTFSAVGDDFNKELGQLESNLKGLSKEIPLTAVELAGIAEIAGQLGVSGADNLTKFTESIAKIKTSTNLTADAAATSFAQLANIMQEPIENIDKMGNVLVDLGNNSATTEANILSLGQRFAGAGAIAGLTSDQVLGISAALNSVGIEAESGGSVMQKILISMKQSAQGNTDAFLDNTAAIGKNNNKVGDLQGKLAIATQQQKEFSDKTKESTKMRKQAQIDKYSSQIAALNGETKTLNATNGQAIIGAASFANVIGVTRDEFSKMFKENPAEVFQKFTEGLARIESEGGDAAATLDELDLSDIRVLRTMLSASNAGTLLADSLKRAGEAASNTEAIDAEFARRQATTASQMQLLTNRLFLLGETIGGPLLKGINDLLVVITPLLERFTAFAEQNPTLVAGILGVVAVLGLLMGLVVVLAPVFSAIATIAGLVTVAMLIVAAQVIVAIAVFAALVAAAMWLWNNMEFVLRSMSDLWKTTTTKIITFVEDTLNAIGEKFPLAESIIRTVMGLIGTVIDQKIGFIVRSFSYLMDNIDMVINMFNSMKDAASSAFSAAGDKISGAFGGGERRHGGVVPGGFNDAVPTVLHGGERVIPKTGTDVNSGGGGGGMTLNLTIQGDVNSEEMLNKITQSIKNSIGRDNELARFGVGVS